MYKQYIVLHWEIFVHSSHLLCLFSYFSDVVSIERTNDFFRILYDVKGRFAVHRIKAEEAKVFTFSLCILIKRSVIYLVLAPSKPWNSFCFLWSYMSLDYFFQTVAMYLDRVVSSITKWKKHVTFNKQL